MSQIFWYNSDLKEKARYLRNNPTYSEKILWNCLKNNALGIDFHRQKPIGYYIYDFYCKELNLLIEIDGDVHDIEQVRLNDERKNEYAKSIGLNLIRFTNEDVLNHIDAVINTILSYKKK